jgi:flagellar motility protein MotE (MotC chaperone)
MTAGAEHRLASGARRLPGILLALAAVAATIAGSSRAAYAQVGWEPVIMANAPVQAPLQPAEARVSKRTPKPSLRAAVPVPAPTPKWDGMPPLATLAAAQAGAKSEPSRATANPPEAADARSAREYCVNIADAAADARLAWQKKTLADLEQEIAKRVELLEAKTAEYQRWLARRDEFSKKAQESVVTIYARMRPDAAAAQLVAMDEETAAAVLTKLDPRNASAILNEMDPAQAARLAGTISGAANVNLPGRPKAQGAEKKS